MKEFVHGYENYFTKFSYLTSSSDRKFELTVYKIMQVVEKIIQQNVNED